MRGMLAPQFQTCRYWAFGNGCPNIDERGLVVCQYAHRDVGGKLSDPDDQRGTCIEWLRLGLCSRGENCYYEHRNTGYLGPYQAQIELSGLDLEIADAAAKAGFDTRNHVALLDLIWAMRRINMNRRKRFVAPRPPKHPVYPDRYRPSGMGDNTRRKRKRFSRQSESQRGLNNSVQTGTQEDPIAIDDDDDHKEAIKTLMNLSAKEQRTAVAVHQHVPARDTVMLMFANPSENERATHELTVVKKCLGTVSETSIDCQKRMHNAFNAFERIRDASLGETLQSLSANMTTCLDASILGVRHVEQVMQYIEDGQDGIS